jgi:hypothetical protein
VTTLIKVNLKQRMRRSHVMMKSSVVAAILLSLAMGMGTARAEDASPAAKPGAADKKAISKSCSDQANAKGLHGKARKEFRSACKHNGGKAA